MDDSDVNMPWAMLAIAPTTDIKAIKNAYAAKLKLTRPDSDPEGYQLLRNSYEHAQWLVRTGQITTSSKPNSGSAGTAGVETQPTVASSLAQPSFENQKIVSNDDLFTLSTHENVTPEIDAPQESAPNTLSVDDTYVDPKKLLKEFESYASSLTDQPSTEIDRWLHAHFDALSIGDRFEINKRVAEWVVIKDFVRAETLNALSQYFEWRADYHVERVLGWELANELRSRIDWLSTCAVSPRRPTERGPVWDEIAVTTRMRAAGLRWRSFMLMLFSRQHSLEVLRNHHAHQLRHAGIALNVLNDCAEAAKYAHWVRIGLVIALIFFVSLLLTERETFDFVFLFWLMPCPIPLYYLCIRLVTELYRWVLVLVAKLVPNFDLRRLEANRYYVLAPLCCFTVSLVGQSLIITILGYATPSTLTTLSYFSNATLAVGTIMLLGNASISPYLIALVTAFLVASTSAAYDGVTIAYALATYGGVFAAIRAEVVLRRPNGAVSPEAYGCRIVFLILAFVLAPNWDHSIRIFAIAHVGAFFLLTFTVGYLNRLSTLAIFGIYWATCALIVIFKNSPTLGLLLWLFLIGAGCLALLLDEVRLGINSGLRHIKAA